jgi:hypothetical protein
MVLTPRRAALITLAACALMTAAYLPPEPTLGPAAVDPPWWSRSSFELRAAETGLFVLEYRDSLLAAMRAHPDEPLLVTLYAAGVLPDSAAATLRSQVAALMPGAPQGGVRIGLALVVQRLRAREPSMEEPPLEAPRYTIAGETINYLPTPEPGSPICLVVARMTTHPRATTAAALAAVLGRISQERQELVGPCWFAREFGAAGPGTAAWLAAGGATFGARFSEQRRQAPTRERPNWLRLALGLVDRPFGSELIWLPYGDHSAAEESCLNGRTERCRDLIADPLGADPRPWFVYWRAEAPGVVTLPASRVASDNRWLLFDLLSAEGRERFSRFWQSGAPFDSAFTDAFGERPGVWMRRWTEANLGPASYPPWPGAGDVALTVAVVLALVMAASALRALRQIG